MTDDAPRPGTGRTPSGEPDPTTGEPADASPPAPGEAAPGEPGAHAAPPPPAAGSAPDAGPGPVSEPVAAGGAEEPPPPPFPTTETVYVAGEPDHPDAVRADPEAETAGITGALAAIGSGLLGAGIVVSSFRAREGEDLDWSVYASGLCALAGLLGLSLVVAFLARRGGRLGARGDLITWPGVVGILGLGLALPVGLEDTDLDGELLYVVGGTIAVLSLAWYAIARRPAFAVTTVLGLGIVYAEAFHQVFSDSIEGDEAAQWVALGVTAFVVVVTLVGWLLPSRTITGVAVGVVGVVGIGASLLGMLVMRTIAGIFSGPGMAGMADMLLGMGGLTGSEELPGSGEDPGSAGLTAWSAIPADYETDVAVVLAYAAGLTLLWAVAAIVSNHSGFKILAIAMLATAVPLGTMVLAVEHPTWWVVGLGGAGAVVLLAALPLVRRRGRLQRLGG